MAAMVEKATFRLPDWELEKLRERSRREGRSLNTVAAEVIAAGLGQTGAAAERMPLNVALGHLLARPARRSWTGPASASSPVPLLDALDWTRGDR
jgi:hypothetical protein